MLGQYYSEQFGSFKATEIDLESKRICLVFDRTKNERWCNIKNFLEGRYGDNMQPWYHGVGFNDYHRWEVYFDLFRVYWKKMIRSSVKRKTHTMDEQWYDFDCFYEFVNKPENKDLHVAITGGFLVAPRNHHYGPDSMIIMPNIKVKGVESED